MEHAGAEDTAADVERKSLGTPATRADIIEKLVRDGFVKRERATKGGKTAGSLIPTEDEIRLIILREEMRYECKSG